MIKMPDAAGLIGLDLVYVLYPTFTIKNEKIKQSFKNFVILVISALLTLTLILLYYIIHDALKDMMYHYFYINFMMTNVDFKLSRVAMLFSWYGLLAAMPIIISLINFIIVILQGDKEKFVPIAIMLFCVLGAAATFTHTTGYIQHTMPISVGYMLAIGYFLKLFPKKIIRYNGIRLVVYSVVIVYMTLMLTKHFSAKNYINPIRKDFNLEARKDDLFMDLIPESERDSVYRFGETENGWYYYNGFYPYYKWLNLRTLIKIGLRDVSDQFEYKMMNDPVEYLIYSGNIRDYEGLFSEKLIEYIENSYNLVATEQKYDGDVGLYKFAD